MATAARKLKNQRVYLRVSEQQREVIAVAAEVAEKDLSAFVLDSALVTADRVLADRRTFPLDDEQWAQFVAVLDQPATSLDEKPRLKKLFEQYAS